MKAVSANTLPKDLLSELEAKFFWWEPVGSQPRSNARILAQAMSLASFDDVRRLEKMLGADLLVETMLGAQPGWIDDRSWEFWRGRLCALRAAEYLMPLRGGRSMPDRFDPRTKILPPAQQEIWSQLAPAPGLSFVLYGGTAVALYLGHRISIDFDFFKAEPLEKRTIEASFRFVGKARTIQEDENTLVLDVSMRSGRVKVSFFGGLSLGRINDPLLTRDQVLLVASLEDLLATKLKAILDRAEAKDYRDISAMLAAGVSLERALGAFAQMYRKDPMLPLRAIGFFQDGDFASFLWLIRTCFGQPGTQFPTYPK